MQSVPYDKDDPRFRTRTAARAAIGCALLLGLAAQQLLWNGPLGIGWVLWIALFAASAVLVVRQAGFPWLRETALAGGVAVCVAAMAALRASDALHALSMLVLVTAASLPLLRARSLRFGSTPVAAQLLGIVAVGGHAIAGVLALLAHDAGPSLVPARMTRGHLAAARGALFAVPPLVVFGALFISADPMFEGYVRGVFGFATEELLGRVVFALAFAWLSAGLLRSLLPQRSPLENLPALPTVPVTEVVIPLAAVTALFAVFVGVQARWLFGGADALHATTGLTVADYARRGFFEMVFAAALVLPLLLTADAVARDATRGARRAMRLLSGALVVLVFAVMTSAFERMTLYTERFGLTEQRLYTTAFMGWLGVVFVWFLITTLRGQRRRFAAGPIAAGIVAVFTLIAANPDALIARVNLERAREGASLDGMYLTRLSADALPVLLPQLNALPQDARCQFSRRWLNRYKDAKLDWRVANRAELRAEALVAANRQTLTGIGQRDCPPQ